MIFAIGGACAALLAPWVAAGYLPTMNIPMPVYRVTAETPDYGVRRYDGYVVAETARQVLGPPRAAL